MNTQVMTPAAAQDELEAWLDWRKILPSQKEAYKDDIEKLADAMTLGLVSIDEEKKIHVKLRFPVGEEGPDQLKELVCKARINDFDLQPYLKNVKAADGDGRILAYKAALTGVMKAQIQRLDSVDQGIMNSVVVFFLN